MKSIFDRIDEFNHSYFGFNPVGALKNISMWRKYIFLLTVACSFCWVVFGWESTWSMLYFYLKSVPALVFGQTTVALVQSGAVQDYGIGQHFSTAVIYGVSFLLLSWHLEKEGIRYSMNFALTAAFSFMSVGVYEVVYNFLYATFQNQAWTFEFVWKQGLNLTVFIFFIVVGVTSLVYVYSCGFRPHVGKWTLVFLAASVLTYCLWIFYPFPVSGLTVQTTAGVWSNTHLFPQTMYAVDLNPVSGVAIGFPYFVGNWFLHFVNVLNKALVSLTVLSFVMVRKIERKF